MNDVIRRKEINKKENTLILGEGAAIFCLEKDTGQNRIAKIEGIGYYTELIEHNVSISTEAECLQKSMKMALKDAGISKVDSIVMHAPGTIQGDENEYKAVKKIFGDELPHLISTKYATGHSFGASGALSMELAILMLKHQKTIKFPYESLPCGTPKELSLTPITIMTIDTIGMKKSRNILKVLLDPGSTKTLINKKCIPKGANSKPLQEVKKVTTIAGSLKTQHMIYLRELKLPEFDKNRKVDELKALVFEGKCRYDIILGADFLTKTGIDINYSTGTMHWFENVRPMREPWKLDNKEYQAMAMVHDI